jgi:hypothetical protein
MTESVGIRHRDVRSGQRGQRRATRGETTPTPTGRVELS